jgi:hypothetical protein
MKLINKKDFYWEIIQKCIKGELHKDDIPFRYIINVVESYETKFTIYHLRGSKKIQYFKANHITNEVTISEIPIYKFRKIIITFDEPL